MYHAVLGTHIDFISIETRFLFGGQRSWEKGTLAESFKELCCPGKKTILFLNGYIVLFFGNETDFRQM